MSTLALAPCWAVWTDGRAILSSKDGAYRFNLAPAIPTLRFPWHVVCRSKTKPPTTVTRSALSLHPLYRRRGALYHCTPVCRPFLLLSSQLMNCQIGAVRPNVQDEPRPRLARAVLLGARIVTAVVVGSGALLGGMDRWQSMPFIEGRSL